MYSFSSMSGVIIVVSSYLLQSAVRSVNLFNEHTTRGYLGLLQRRLRLYFTP